MHIADDYRISELKVQNDDWIANKMLRACKRWTNASGGEKHKVVVDDHEDDGHGRQSSDDAIQPTSRDRRDTFGFRNVRRQLEPVGRDFERPDHISPSEFARKKDTRCPRLVFGIRFNLH